MMSKTTNLSLFYLFTVVFPDLTTRLNSHALSCISQTVQARIAYD
jgi:hypothetical protein